jgi:glycosyltransferase involved in cell wall biosynthesis
MTVAGTETNTPRKSRRGLRVLIVCTRYFPDIGGAETHVYEVLKRLSKLPGLEFTILTTDLSGKLPPYDVVNGVTVLRVPAWPRNRDYYFAPRITAIVGQPDRWDLVHCQGIHNFVPLLTMLAARRAGIPYMVTFHTGGHSKRLRNLLRATQWRVIGPLLRRASMLIAVSRFEAELLGRQARLSDSPMTVIRNGGALPTARADVEAIPGRIVSSGRLERYKGHHRVIEALPDIVKDCPEAHLVILGSGPYEKDLRELAVGLGVGDRVTIREIPPADRLGMANALREASVIAALSDYEAHPIAVMEALCVGRPVVGYDTAGIGELVAEGWVTGVSPGAPADIVARRLAAAMLSSTPVDPGELPTWDSCAKQLADVYMDVAGKIAAARL